MARSISIIDTPIATRAVFDFVSDLRNAPYWDPMTIRVVRHDAGPVRVGTTYTVHGRVFGRALELPYEVTTIEAGRRLSLRGTTRWLRYDERLSFTPRGRGTRITWEVAIELRSVLAPGNVVLRPLWPLMSAHATRRLPRALQEHASGQRHGSARGGVECAEV